MLWPLIAYNCQSLFGGMHANLAKTKLWVIIAQSGIDNDYLDYSEPEVSISNPERRRCLGFFFSIIILTIIYTLHRSPMCPLPLYKTIDVFGILPAQSIPKAFLYGTNHDCDTSIFVTITTQEGDRR